MNTILENSPAIHEWDGPTGVHFRDLRSAAGNYYHDTTPPEVVAALDAAMASGARVRLWYGDAATGRNWMDEYNVCGTVGRSTGWKHTALLIANARSMGGAPILADCIVRLDVGGRTVYQHPGFSLPSILTGHEGADARAPFAAWVNGEQTPHARFKTQAAADRWAAFMRGERACK